MTASVFNVERGIPTPAPMSRSTSGSEKLSAANALPRKPDRVMATCMVDRKRDGSLIRWLSRMAFLLPSSASFAIFVSLVESTAISALANIAFNAISTT